MGIRWGRLVGRLAVILLGNLIWFSTQTFLGARVIDSDRCIGDAILDVLGPLNAWLHTHLGVAHALLIASSLIIDALVFYILFITLFGESFAPFLSMFMIFLIRQGVQSLISLPPPAGIIWEDPGFPAIFVTYGVASDFFFSGHTSMAVIGGAQLVARGGLLWPVLGVAVAVFEMFTVLVLHAHYTMDVFTGLVAALWALSMGPRLSAAVDWVIARVLRRDAPQKKLPEIVQTTGERAKSN